MFNPLRVLLKENSQSDSFFNEEISLKDFYIDDVQNFSKKIVSQHKKFIDYQKSVFQNIKKNETLPNQKAYEILTYKSGKYTDAIFGHVTDGVYKTAQYLTEKLEDTKEQIRIIKACYNKSKYLFLKEKVYSCSGVGFKTMELPTLEEYESVINVYRKAWKLRHPLDKDSITKHFDDYYIKKDKMRDEMYDEIEWIFKEDKPYRVKDFVEAYDDMNQQLISLLIRHRKKYTSIRDFLEEVRNYASSHYEEDITGIKSSLILSQEDKDKMVNLATHNYQILSNSIILLSDMVAAYHNIQLKIIISSYSSYKKVIQKIYDNVIDEV